MQKVSKSIHIPPSLLYCFHSKRESAEFLASV